MCGSVRCVWPETGCLRRPPSGFGALASLFFLALLLSGHVSGDAAEFRSASHLAGFGFLGLGHLFGRRAEALAVLEPPQVPGAILRPARKPVVEQSAGVAAVPEAQSCQQDETERLIAHVLAAPAGQPGRCILVTHVPSPEAPLGALECAAFASHFARGLALQGRAILVMLGAAGGNRPGLYELVEGGASFSEAIHRESGSRLHFLPAGRGRTPSGSGLDMVVDALAETYDFVVLVTADDDGALARRHALALAPRADQVLLACAGQVGSPDMLALRDGLRDAGAGEVVAARIGLGATEARAAA